MSKRLDVLKESLAKKQGMLDSKLANHYASVKEANGQPLNDKCNGRATLSKWERQNDALRSIQAGIETTKQAIEREESKIAAVNAVALPAAIREMLDAGDLVQWRKHPNRFFVSGVDRGRIIWDEDKQVVAYKFLADVSPAHYPIFRDTFNRLRRNLAANT